MTQTSPLGATRARRRLSLCKVLQKRWRAGGDTRPWSLMCMTTVQAPQYFRSALWRFGRCGVAATGIVPLFTFQDRCTLACKPIGSGVCTTGRNLMCDHPWTIAVIVLGYTALYMRQPHIQSYFALT